MRNIRSDQIFIGCLMILAVLLAGVAISAQTCIVVKAPPGKQVFTTNGTFNWPLGHKTIYYAVWGGGGGAGGTANSSYRGGNGSGGACQRGSITYAGTNPRKLEILIGSGGGGGAYQLINGVWEGNYYINEHYAGGGGGGGPSGIGWYYNVNKFCRIGASGGGGGGGSFYAEYPGGPRDEYPYGYSGDGLLSGHDGSPVSDGGGPGEDGTELSGGNGVGDTPGGIGGTGGDCGLVNFSWGSGGNGGAFGGGGGGAFDLVSETGNKSYPASSGGGGGGGGGGSKVYGNPYNFGAGGRGGIFNADNLYTVGNTEGFYGSGNFPGYSSCPDLPSGVALGGTSPGSSGNGSSGTDGCVIIYWGQKPW